MAKRPITPSGAKRREERLKLFATFLSNLGVAAIVTGFLSPLLLGRLGWAQAVAVLVGVALHACGQLVLEWVVRTEPEEAK